ncbi:MAG: hypothetical protein IT307_10825 [Chloroflexi bacterium]|nr:hypothetical protein [Chloroflexota bacterium]
MQTAVSTSPLRLPAPDFDPGDPRGEEPRAGIELLARQAFDGLAVFEAGDWTAEILFRGGQMVAAGLAGPGRADVFTGEAALAALLQTGAPWLWRAAPLPDTLLICLTGLGATPEPKLCRSVADLRGLLRDLALRGRPGLLEASAGVRWGRVPIAPGRLLGCWSSSVPTLQADLSPLEAVLHERALTLSWWPALGAAAPVMSLPPLSKASSAGSQAVLERCLVWLFSDFEGAWARDRERGASPEALVAALDLLLERIRQLVGILQRHWSENPKELELQLKALRAIRGPAVKRVETHISEANARQTGAILVELVSQALDQLVEACPEAAVAEACRQTADALESELRARLAARPRGSH